MRVFRVCSALLIAVIMICNCCEWLTIPRSRLGYCAYPGILVDSSSTALISISVKETISRGFNCRSVCCTNPSACSSICNLNLLKSFWFSLLQNQSQASPPMRTFSQQIRLLRVVWLDCHHLKWDAGPLGLVFLPIPPKPVPPPPPLNFVVTSSRLCDVLQLILISDSDINHSRTVRVSSEAITCNKCYRS